LIPPLKEFFQVLGGDDSIRLLPYVDFKAIAQNPKIFIGFSDTTVNHFMCLKAGLSSFYGPAVMTAFAENIEMHAYTIQGIKRVLFSNEVIGEIPQNKEGWTKEHLDWATPSNQNIKRHLNPSLEWNFMRSSEKRVQGRLIGGCVEALQFINGTSIWPNLEMWEECILFLETSEEGTLPITLARFLRNLGAQGILEKVKGILFSKPGGSQISPDQFAEYDKAILQIFEEYVLPIMPIVTHMDFGHADPMWTLPYGCLAEIDPVQRRVSLLESGVL
jgi:muramoyltetrapeptide carboxypeptidase LdcA involved in peptidoglycan recycling